MSEANSGKVTRYFKHVATWPAIVASPPHSAGYCSGLEKAGWTECQANGDPLPAKCEECGGERYVAYEPDGEVGPCLKCGGSGQQPTSAPFPMQVALQMNIGRAKCDECGGKGRIVVFCGSCTCPKCSGSGKQPAAVPAEEAEEPMIELFNFVGKLGLSGKQHSEFFVIYKKIKSALAAIEMQEALELNNQMKQIVDEACDERDAAVAEAASNKSRVEEYDAENCKLMAEAVKWKAECVALCRECDRLQREVVWSKREDHSF